MSLDRCLLFVVKLLHPNFWTISFGIMTSSFWEIYQARKNIFLTNSNKNLFFQILWKSCYLILGSYFPYHLENLHSILRILLFLSKFSEKNQSEAHYYVAMLSNLDIMLAFIFFVMANLTFFEKKFGDYSSFPKKWKEMLT